MNKFFNSPWTYVYMGSILLVNLIFANTQPIFFPSINAALPVATLIVGLTFVLRDFTQRSIGKWVLLAMAIAAGLTYLISPGLALASAAAFAISEFADWAMYTFTKKPFAQRILLSSLISTPIDSVAFLWLADFIGHPDIPFPFFTVGSVIVMTLSKMVAAVILAWALWDDKGIAEPYPDYSAHR